MENIVRNLYFDLMQFHVNKLKNEILFYNTNSYNKIYKKL